MQENEIATFAGVVFGAWLPLLAGYQVSSKLSRAIPAVIRKTQHMRMFVQRKPGIVRQFRLPLIRKKYPMKNCWRYTGGK